MCGIIIYFPNSLRDNPPLLCKSCEISGKLALDFNPLQIAWQHYVRNEESANEKFIDEKNNSDIVPLINPNDGLDAKKIRKKKSNDFKI